jgi:hypothetical protein
LITQKSSDFLLFKEVYNLIVQKEHLNKEGIKKIVSIKSVLNKGLPNQLKAVFPDAYFIRPPVKTQIIPDSN